MVNIKIENNKFIYENENCKKILLDCGNYMENKSSVPLCSPQDMKSTLSYYLVSLYQTYINLFEKNYAPNDNTENFLVDILLAAELIKTPLPVKIVELGCTNGRLSYHLASVLGKIHPKSTLCCVCNEIGNESGNFWLDMVSLVRNPPKLSMLASDYDDTNLSTHHFDVVVVNGAISMEACEVMKEAKRLVKTNGLLICCSWNQPDLVENMKKQFISVEEYQTNADVSILIAHANDVAVEYDEITEWKKEAFHDLAQSEVVLASDVQREELVELIQKLNYNADFATEHNILDIKVKSIDVKEKLLMKYVTTGTMNN